LSGQPPGETDILSVADTMPCFPACPKLPAYSPAHRSCAEKALADWFSSNMTYPETARQHRAEGTVTVSFVVAPDGQVGQVAVLHDIGHGCGEAAAKAVRDMPPWFPGRHEGVPAAVRLSMPLQFRLRDRVEAAASPYWLSWGDLSAEIVGRKQLMENLDKPVYVRDTAGTAISIQHLRLSYRHKKRQRHRIGPGAAISPEQRTLLRKARRGGIIVLEADCRAGAQQLSVSRTFRVADPRHQPGKKSGTLLPRTQALKKITNYGI
jgi:TonB family protein